MQNSLERLFDGLVVSLRESVLPEVGDPYARAQVAAAIEVLANLAGRVEWRCSALAEEIEQLRAVLAEADPGSALLADEVPAGNDALVAARRSHLAALARVQESPPAAVAEPLREFIAWQLEREAALLRTGMYK